MRRILSHTGSIVASRTPVVRALSLSYQNKCTSLKTLLEKTEECKEGFKAERDSGASVKPVCSAVF